ncbi:hypothetical protein A2803_01460 [Candidatus Woesebacteria bacterium RIFCSPHIGHO2_01_FULL_44_21]|uniref:SRCR domain-containing protein n=1 Tax=Candidatus Woesebacteria bacterium RIFCSPHIGHO2_01_FULL_44_21 TaxID=1802503 RepID=A0A1F7YZB2_9BACT|nr:MAG: hypothetical protein A2803_01460 [Candidatus Woesebacteria bacterium RIFCSPHIGHO2_01_FULL_44_21]
MKKSVSCTIILSLLVSLFLPSTVNAQVCGDVYQGRMTFCSLLQLNNNGTVPSYSGCGFGELCYIGNIVGNNQCGWVVDNDGLKFCFGGFSSESDLRSTTVQIQCVSNCGGAGIVGPDSPDWAAGDVVQTFSNTNAPTGDDGQGGRFSCIQVGGFDQSVIDAINWQIDTVSLACGVAGAGAFLASGPGGLVTGLVLRVTVTAGSAGLVQQCVNLANQYTPTFETRIVNPGGNTVCAQNQTIALNAQDQVIDPGTGVILDPRGGILAQCDADTQGINSAIGCIPITNINLTTQFFLRWALGVGGGIALFLIAISGIRIMTTRGDPKRLQDARDTLSAAIAGLVLIVLSVFLVRFLTETLLQLF